MEKIKVVLLVLVAQVVCGNPLSETEREAAETTENLKRLLNDGNLRIGDLYTSFFFPVSWAAENYGTYAQNTEFCEGLGGGPLTLTSQRKIDILRKVTDQWSVYRWLGVKRLPQNGKWQWATGEDMEPSNLKWQRNDPAYQCIEVYLAAEYSVKPYSCEGGSSHFACEVEGQRYPHVQTPDSTVVKNIKTRFIVVNDPSKNYAEAKAACESEGIGSGKLATPSSDRELEVIDRQLRLISEEMGGGPGAGRQDFGYWLGAKRNFRGAPTWNTGFKIVGNLRPFVDENGGRCLLYIADAATPGSLGKFDWVNCGDSQFSGYICQIDEDLVDG